MELLDNAMDEHPIKTVLAALIICVGIIVTLVFIGKAIKKATSDSFMNKSYAGFYYETENMSFRTTDDRNIAIAALLKLLADSGVVYKPEQLEHISDEFIISIVESEDDNDFAHRAAKLVILIDPNYKIALQIVNVASKNNNTITSSASRQVVYDLLVKYFATLKTPIGNPLNQWSDILLIRAFRTLELPSKADFMRFPNAAATNDVPPGVTTVTPTIATPVSSADTPTSKLASADTNTGSSIPTVTPTVPIPVSG